MVHNYEAAEPASRQHSIADHAPNGRGPSGEGSARRIDRYRTAIDALAFAATRYLVVVTQGADTVVRPAIAIAGRLSRAFNTAAID